MAGTIAFASAAEDIWIAKGWLFGRTLWGIARFEPDDADIQLTLYQAGLYQNLELEERDGVTDRIVRALIAWIDYCDSDFPDLGPPLGDRAVTISRTMLDLRALACRHLTEGGFPHGTLTTTSGKSVSIPLWIFRRMLLQLASACAWETTVGDQVFEALEHSHMLLTIEAEQLLRQMLERELEPDMPTLSKTLYGIYRRYTAMLGELLPPPRC